MEAMSNAGLDNWKLENDSANLEATISIERTRDLIDRIVIDTNAIAEGRAVSICNNGGVVMITFGGSDAP
jgi:hypothetical protein